MTDRKGEQKKGTLGNWYKNLTGNLANLVVKVTGSQQKHDSQQEHCDEVVNASKEDLIMFKQKMQTKGLITNMAAKQFYLRKEINGQKDDGSKNIRDNNDTNESGNLFEGKETFLTQTRRKVADSTPIYRRSSVEVKNLSILEWKRSSGMWEDLGDFSLCATDIKDELEEIEKGLESDKKSNELEEGEGEIMSNKDDDDLSDDELNNNITTQEMLQNRQMLGSVSGTLQVFDLDETQLNADKGVEEVPTRCLLKSVSGKNKLFEILDDGTGTEQKLPQNRKSSHSYFLESASGKLELIDEDDDKQIIQDQSFIEENPQQPRRLSAARDSLLVLVRDDEEELSQKVFQMVDNENNFSKEQSS